MEEVIALTLLTMEKQPLDIKLILWEVKYLFDLGSTPHELTTEMKGKIRTYLSNTHVPYGPEHEEYGLAIYAWE
jgi:hypothetical protein